MAAPDFLYLVTIGIPSMLSGVGTFALIDNPSLPVVAIASLVASMITCSLMTIPRIGGRK